MPDNWEKVREVFFEAVELPSGEQAGFLETACLGDGDLWREVNSLLEADRTHAHDIELAVEAAAQQLVGADPVIGSRFGAWRVSREIGRGGMGVVYLAVRDDAQFQKEAALKLIRAGMDSSELLLRFRHERQILANLDHPYIARLMDGGTTPEGRPFLVMDYVDGLRIDSWCSGQGLGVEERCRLFLKVCEAVSYAHRGLVVHRDLKPGNILIAADGSPKLVDFGIAKLMVENRTTAVTAASPALTPDYASPEQVLGEPITTAADIYSLGAIFYELLSHSKPHRLGSATPVEIERAVCHTEIARPSSAVPADLPNAMRLKRRLSGDLDNIVMMALRKEPARRYRSVDQFAEDIHRHLDGLPVRARQNSVGYRARKFVRRRRFELAGAAIVVASLLAGMAMAVSQWRQAEAARGTAETHRKTAEAERGIAERESARAKEARRSETRQRQIADEQRDAALRERAIAEQRLSDLLDLADRTLFDVHDAIAEVPGALETRQKIVKTTLAYLEGLEKTHGLDDRMRLAISSAYRKIGEAQGDPLGPSLQDSEGALASYRKSEAMLAPLYQSRTDNPDVVLRWLQIERDVSNLNERSGHGAEVVKNIKSLLPVARRLREMGPDKLEWAKQEAELMHCLAWALHNASSPETSERTADDIRLWQDLVTRFPSDLGIKRQLGAAYSGAAASMADDMTLAASYYEKSIRMREELLRARPDDMALRRDLIVSYGNYSGLLGIPWQPNLQRYAEARIYGAKSVALAREMTKADPHDLTARYDLGVSLARLGMVEPEDGGLSESLQSLREAIEIIEPVANGNPKSIAVRVQLALAQQYAGRRLQSLGQAAAAREQYEKSLDRVSGCTARPMVASCALQTIRDDEELATLSTSTGDYAAAKTFARRAVTLAHAYAESDRKTERRAVQLARADGMLAAILNAAGEGQEARDLAAQALSIWKSVQDQALLKFHHDSIAEAEAMLR